MSTDPLAAAFASTRSVMAKVRPEQLTQASPCAAWNVAQVVNHAIGAARQTCAWLGGDDPAALTEEDFAAGDYLSTYDAIAAQTVELFGRPEVLEQTVTLPFGEVSGSFIKYMVTTDQFVHGWDLAHATGQDTDLSPALAGELLSLAQARVTDAFRGEDGKAPFGARQEAGADAPPADQLAAFLGRAVS